MKVSELIEALQQLPQDAKVLISEFDGYATEYTPLEKEDIWVTKKGVHLT
jgi:hypothetical protein